MGAVRGDRLAPDEMEGSGHSSLVDRRRLFDSRDLTARTSCICFHRLKRRWAGSDCNAHDLFVRSLRLSPAAANGP